MPIVQAVTASLVVEPHLCHVPKGLFALQFRRVVRGRRRVTRGGGRLVLGHDDGDGRGATIYAAVYDRGSHLEGRLCNEIPRNVYDRTKGFKGPRCNQSVHVGHNRCYIICQGKK